MASADDPSKKHLFCVGFASAYVSRALPQTTNSDLMFRIGSLGDAKPTQNRCLRLGEQPANHRNTWNIYFAWGLRQPAPHPLLITMASQRKAHIYFAWGLRRLL